MGCVKAQGFFQNYYLITHFNNPNNSLKAVSKMQLLQCATMHFLRQSRDGICEAVTAQSCKSVDFEGEITCYSSCVSLDTTQLCHLLTNHCKYFEKKNACSETSGNNSHYQRGNLKLLLFIGCRRLVLNSKLLVFTTFHFQLRTFFLLRISFCNIAQIHTNGL